MTDWLYYKWWQSGQFILWVLWQFPARVHEWLLRLTGWRIVKQTSPIDGRLVNYWITKKYPPEFTVNNHIDATGNEWPPKKDFITHLREVVSVLWPGVKVSEIIEVTDERHNQ